jgi:beta-glucosidase/6-phospho-beta-glucosidase/beta-galactosidase
MADGTRSAAAGRGGPFPESFAFATGIECSYPVVTGLDGRSRRVDELERCFHYERWREDLGLVRELGVRYLRYGPPLYRMHLGPGRYDWSFADDVFEEMHRLGIEPIADLCHFGVPDWFDGFQDPDWPALFADYAEAFAARYPWVRLYTPVNEIFVAAKLSGLFGLWNERRHDERSFVTALKHLAGANLLAAARIQSVRPDAWFIQSESAEYFHQGGSDPECAAVADFENQRRFLSADLLYSHPVRDDVRAYLRANGLTDDDYAWFMAPRPRDNVVLGLDFYRRNEQIVMPGGGIDPTGDVFGWYPIARQYHDRYRLPLMHTETNNIGGGEDDAPGWLWRQFLGVRLLASEGVPVIGFTWYSLHDQLDWDTGLAEDRNMLNPIGLYDLDRRPRPVATAYRELIRANGGAGEASGIDAGNVRGDPDPR